MAHRVQELFSDTTVEMSRSIPGDMQPDLRDRHITHVVSSLAEKIVKVPGTNPRGWVITVTSEEPTSAQPRPDLRVVATIPLFAQP